jgi:signal transduction histidine kinase/CheY-like chemotaxis protein
MARDDVNFRQELGPAFVVMLLLVGAAGLLLALAGELLFGRAWQQANELALLCWGVAGAGLLLLRVSETGSRWFAVTALAALVLFGAARLQDPAVLAWLVLPNLLAVAFLGVGAGALLALGQTLLLLAVGGLGGPGGALGLLAVGGLDGPGGLGRLGGLGGLSGLSGLGGLGSTSGLGGLGATGVTLGLVWAVLPVAGLLARTFDQVFRWSVAAFDRADAVMREARGRQGELNQAIADLSHANQQLARLNRLAQSLRQAADEARATKEHFVANVSHELRTPLNMVIGFSETMLDSPELYGVALPPALLADLAVIHRNAEHLSSLIDDVLDLSQSEAGEMMLSCEYIPYQELVAGALTAVRPLFVSKQLALAAEIPDDLPPVYCDPLRMREVLMNLLSNAGRFTEEGGVCVRVWCDGDQLHTAVADTGLGIAADKLPHLFQPFYQVDSSLRRRFGGTGLGLSISKRFVELHAGKIWVESTAGAGTTFVFRIPIRPPAPVAVPAQQKLVEGWEFLGRLGPGVGSRGAAPARYLVVDASDTLARLLRRSDSGAEVTCVPSLAAAGEELRRFEAQVLLVNAPAATAAADLLATGALLPHGTPALFCTLPGADAAPGAGALSAGARGQGTAGGGALGEGALGEGAAGEGAAGEGAAGEGAAGEGAAGEGAAGEGAAGEGAAGEGARGQGTAGEGTPGAGARGQGAPAEGAQIRLVKPVARQALLDALDALGVTGGTVLIVDDEPDARHLFGRMLAPAGTGLRILQARDGVEALAILQTATPDVIVLDLVMPNMDGFQLLAHKQQDPVLRAIPVIIVSAQDAARQPILAANVVLSRGGGISAGDLLRAIRFTAQMLDHGAPVGDPAPPAGLSG